MIHISTYIDLLIRFLPSRKLHSIQPPGNRLEPRRRISLSPSLESSKSTPENNTKSTSKKIANLIRNRRFDEALQVFKSARNPNTLTCNSILNLHAKRGEVTKARALFSEMTNRDTASWNILISAYMACSDTNYIEEARRLFEQMPFRDLISWNTMISGYSRHGLVDDSFLLFNCMPTRDVVSWNAMITGLLHSGNVKSALEVFDKMPVRDYASVSGIVAGLVRNGELENASGFLMECEKRRHIGLNNFVDAYNTLIAGYGKKGRVDDARRLFDRMPLSSDCSNKYQKSLMRNVVTWNSMIMCYVKCGDIVSSRDLFEQMQERDAFTWNTLISGYVHKGDMCEAMNIFNRMPEPDILSWNCIISGFSLAGRLDSARDFFERAPRKNIITWNSIISGCERNGDCRGAIELFMRMQVEGGETPDKHTLSSLLSVCASSVDLNLGIQLHQQIVKRVFADMPVNNSLITMYSRCGELRLAHGLFDEVKVFKNVISWNAIIGGYAAHGYAEKALEVFDTMKKSGIRPTYITFVSVLNACSHAGFVEEARLQFKSMTSEFGIQPRVEHLSSLVDVVGRYGHLEEAMGLIRGMGFEPDKAVWGAMLGACRVYKNIELARVAAEELMKLEPESSAPFILLRNVYMELGQWDDAEEVRMTMRRNNIQKELGCSWVGHS